MKEVAILRQKFSRIIGIIMILAGLFLVGQHFLSGYFVGQNQAEVSVAGMSAADLKNNQGKEGEFDYNAVRNVSEKEIRESRERIEKGLAGLNVIGALAMPEADINVSIMKGLSEDVLLSGAGTFYPDQEMGKGNYPLASHNMNTVRRGLLLSPILDKAKIGQKIYMTDLDKVYIYEVDMAEVVAPTRVDLVSPEAEKPTVTLMTCTADGQHRMIVQGKLQKTIPFKEADKKILDYFDIEAEK